MHRAVHLELAATSSLLPGARRGNLYSTSCTATRLVSYATHLRCFLGDPLVFESVHAQQPFSPETWWRPLCLPPALEEGRDQRDQFAGYWRPLVLGRQVRAPICVRGFIVVSDWRTILVSLSFPHPPFPEIRDSQARICARLQRLLFALFLLEAVCEHCSHVAMSSYKAPLALSLSQYYHYRSLASFQRRPCAHPPRQPI